MKQRRIYALGFFDGVHLGHQALLAECVRLAEKLNVQSAAITFDRHPASLFTETPPALINSAEDRQRLLRQYGVGPIYTFPVAEEIMSTPWRDFLEELLEFGAAGFVCGHDFRFGHKGEGNAEKLAQFCQEKALPCIIVPEQRLEGVRISSTHIRALIEDGDMDTAAEFLGHPHFISGQVVSGRQLGRTIGIPTANVLIPEGVVVPRLGVYASTCVVDGETYVAVTNIGSRPTVGGHQTRAESWLLDFEGDLYGKHILVRLHKFLRPEQKFESLEELQAQIRQDAAQAKAMLG